MCGNVRSGRQSGHLTITRIEQSPLLQLLAHAGNQGQVQRIIRGIARNQITGNDLTGRLGSGCHQLQLGQVWPVVFAVTVLHDALLGNPVVAVGSGAIQANALLRQLIDLAGALPEIRFQVWPGCVLQPPQHNAQAVVGELDGTEGLPQSTVRVC